MTRREPMSPPDIRGFRFERLLGSGGYSDVFLYQQEMPRRPVAIKVLLADRLDDRALRQVGDEANAMAAVSTHPYIVTIFHAELAGPGNPYLVMEYYPRPNYSVRARTEQMSVAEVLRAGVQVASAVETAHRAGIVHRDIKPANILTSEYGRPGLTDFGIAGLSGGTVDPAEGLSVPWSPPEIVLGTSGGDVASDVYSLGATVYSLLAGRSPFEVVGGSNRTLDLLERIDRCELPPTGRPDVPAEVERLLRHAMARRPDDRPSSAADLARALQDIEVQQQFAMTPLEVRDEAPLAPRARGALDEEDGTRLKSPTVIQSQRRSGTPAGSTVDGGSGATSGAAALGADPTTSTGLVRGVPGVAPEGATVMRSSLPGPLDARVAGDPSLAFPPSAVAPMPQAPGPDVASSTYTPLQPPTHVRSAAQTGTSVGSTTEDRKRRLVRTAWIVLVVVALLAVVRIAMGTTPTTPPTTTTNVVVNQPGGVVRSAKPPSPTDVTVDGVVARWKAPDGMEAGDRFIVTPAGRGIEDKFGPAQLGPGDTSVTVPNADPAGTTCVWVRTVRNSAESEPAGNCPTEGR